MKEFIIQIHKDENIMDKFSKYETDENRKRNVRRDKIRNNELEHFFCKEINPHRHEFRKGRDSAAKYATKANPAYRYLLPVCDANRETR